MGGTYTLNRHVRPSQGCDDKAIWAHPGVLSIFWNQSCGNVRCSLGLSRQFWPCTKLRSCLPSLVFIHGLFGHPQKTWTGQELEQNLSHRPHMKGNASKTLATELKNSIHTDGPSASSDYAEKGLGTAQDAPPESPSKERPDTLRSNWAGSSGIFGLRDGEVFWPAVCNFFKHFARSVFVHVQDVFLMPRNFWDINP